MSRKTQQVKEDTERDQNKDTLDDEELEELYKWVDQIPLSRPKRNISRDFSDGVLVAEIIHYFCPSIVDLHNYSAANATDKKNKNWYLLNRKVFKKLNFDLAPDVIEQLVNAKPGVVEKVLLMLQVKIKNVEYERRRQSEKPEADQYAMSPGRRPEGKVMKVTMEDRSKGRMKQSPVAKNNKAAGLEQRPTIPKKKPVRTLMESDMVPRVMLEEKEQEMLAKEEMTQMMQAKISRLEHLLHLKDLRIEELQNRLEATRPTGVKR